MVFIITSKTSPRLLYTLDWVLTQVFAWEYSIIQSGSKLPKDAVAISLEEETEDRFFHLPCSHVLFETDVNTESSIFREVQNGIQWLRTERSSVDFDILGSIFFFLSRYEEYFPYEADGHGRFSSKSASFNPAIPYVDAWIWQLEQQLRQQFPTLPTWEPRFEVKRTLDIDMVYKYKARSLLRSAGGFLRDLVQFNLREVTNRISVLSGYKNDPYFVFPQLPNTGLEIFVHGGDKTTAYDKQTGLHSQEFVDFLRNTQNKIGIHPSYFCIDRANLLKQEKSQLEKVCGHSIQHSRFHFLRFTLPTGYKILIENNIKEDYSMGYADALGFRAGTSRSFPWFDLSQNKQVALKIHPFIAMDVTLKNYLKLSIEESRNQLQALSNTVQKYGGVFCLLFHNSSLSQDSEWKDWETLFDAYDL